MMNADIIVNSQKIKTMFRHICKPLCDKYNLTQNEVDILLFLKNNQNFDTANDIVKIRGIAKSHVCKSVTNLTQIGFIEEIKDEQDRRRIHLIILPKAEKVVLEAKIFFKIIHNGITPEETKALQSAYTKISNNIKEFAENLPKKMK
ncbi:MAG: MarR family winged helix-turn-helix transcriptional regulator [Oscillospiraceae bacterium]